MYPIESASMSLCNPAKQRCGDACAYQWLDDCPAMIACVCDGVGCSWCDWLASELTVKTFEAVFTGNSGVPLHLRLEHAARAANERVLEEVAIRGKTLLSTLVAIAWDCASDTLHFCIVGDSRLYILGPGGLRQAGSDQKKAVAMRGRDGKLLNSGGVVVVASGLTNAVGTPDARFHVETLDMGGNHGVLLCTDGLVECEAFGHGLADRIFSHLDMSKALAAARATVRDSQNDDVTAIFLRKANVAQEERERILAALDSGAMADGAQRAYPALRVLAEELEAAVAAGNTKRAATILDHARRWQLDFGLDFLKKAADASAVKGNHALLQRLVDEMRRSW